MLTTKYTKHKIMQRIVRNPGKFEALDVFTAFSREHDYKLKSPEDLERFLEQFRESLKASQENQILLHGKRMEACFSQVAAGLHGCTIIKTEDTGDVISESSDILLPDYRLVLKDGRQIFVEVKNTSIPNPTSKYLLRKDYVEKLQRYSSLNGVPLYFAIYYRCLRMWALLPISSFVELKHKYEITPIHSIAKSEMAMLGDVILGVKPPLIFELVADRTKDAFIDEDSRANFICGEVKIHCDNQEVEDPEEKKIAFYLMRFGRWDCGKPEGVLDDNGELHSVRFKFYPESSEGFERDGFAMLGSISSMITEAYNEHTVYEQEVTAISTKAEPDVFSVDIPKDYKGEVLGLWRFAMQANPEFNMDFEGVGQNKISVEKS
ncbi:hypothetical protein WMR32_005265 [Klebsiella oxytoca]|nr:hypothetical protein [Klebsiella oxytoca]HEJ8155950.1 hypothetical protein [Klebsiella oxytoca]